MMDDKLIEHITNSYKRGKSVRRILHPKGKISIDQKLPYLCIYRFKNQPDPYLAALLKTQGAYLIVEESVDISHLVECLMDIAVEDFNSFMMVEIWNDTNFKNVSTFKIYYPEGKVSATVHAFEKGLADLCKIQSKIKVKAEGTTERRGPEGSLPFVSIEKIKKSGALLIGISVPSLFWDKEKERSFPLFFRKIQRKFADTIKIAAFEFVRGQTESTFVNYLMLGKTQLDHAARSADKRMAAIDQKMNFILSVTPVNAESEWEKFQENKFAKSPNFTYRLISIDPELEKRKLFNIPLDKIEDPTLAFILRDKRTELEKQLLMLEERGSKKFFYSSQSIYGNLDENIIESATALLNYEMPAEIEEYDAVNAAEFAIRTNEELDIYRKEFPKIPLSVKVKDNVTGLIVSGPELSVGATLNISEERVQALIQHEVGTHLLTYCNGHRQPLHLMYAGLAGYEQLQEGIAVLAEFLVGGLNVNRLRLLAARVVAVNALIHGADFIECYDMLCKQYGFCGKNAFNITMRVFRGGGYTKDAIYLKGLIQVLNFIKEGGEITHLYSGKFALEHLPLIEELEHRRILKKPVLPGFLTTKTSKEKITKIKKGIHLTELIN